MYVRRKGDEKKREKTKKKSVINYVIAACSKKYQKVQEGNSRYVWCSCQSVYIYVLGKH